MELSVMKLRVLLTIILFNSCVFGQYLGDGPKDAVIGSPHDLRKFANNRTKEIAVCDYCHTKPETITGESSMPWNREVTGRSYAFYGSATFNAGDIPGVTLGSGGMASNATLLCLSCHDGAVAYGDTGRNLRAGGRNAWNSSLQGVAVNLLGDHPVHFIYDSQLATTYQGLQLPAEGISMAIPYVGRRTSLPLYKESPKDASGHMECATCHNPHDGTTKYFLRMNNTRSALCLNCH